MSLEEELKKGKIILFSLNEEKKVVIQMFRNNEMINQDYFAFDLDSVFPNIYQALTYQNEFVIAYDLKVPCFSVKMISNGKVGAVFNHPTFINAFKKMDEGLAEHFIVKDNSFRRK